jgi:arylformamidase
MTPAELEAQYNNRALVPDHADYFARWKTDSAAARHRLRPQQDIPYMAGGTSGNKQVLDVFAAQRSGSPVVVFIHGGYWRSLDKSDHSFLAPALLDMGACVVVPNYGLCPETAGRPVTIPDICLQMVQAVRWAWHHAAEFGGDPRRLVVVGHSAGGQLAAMLLNTRWQAVDARLPRQLLRAAMSISGLYDLMPLTRTPFLQESLRLTNADALRCSPAAMPAPRQGVLYSLAGALESSAFLAQNRLIEQAWGRAVVPVCEELGGRHHFSVLDALTEPADPLHVRLSELLGRV